MLDGLSNGMDFPLGEKNVTGFANGVSDLEGSTECLIWQTDTTAGKNKKTTKKSNEWMKSISRLHRTAAVTNIPKKKRKQKGGFLEVHREPSSREVGPERGGAKGSLTRAAGDKAAPHRQFQSLLKVNQSERRRGDSQLRFWHNFFLLLLLFLLLLDVFFFFFASCFFFRRSQRT